MLVEGSGRDEGFGAFDLAGPGPHRFEGDENLLDACQAAALQVPRDPQGAKHDGRVSFDGASGVRKIGRTPSPDLAMRKLASTSNNER